MSGARSLRSRKNAERRGRYSEHIAAWSYRIKGFRVLAKRYRTPFGEIDLVLRRRSLVIFAEVKARATFEEALLAFARNSSNAFPGRRRSIFAITPNTISVRPASI